MNSGQIIAVFLHSVTVCLAVVGLWLYYRKHFANQPPSDASGSDTPPPPFDDDDDDTDAAPASAAPASADYSYRRRPLLSGEEKQVLEAISQLLGDDTAVLPQVASWAWIEPVKSGDAYFQRLAGESFDLLICDRPTMQPLYAIRYKRKDGKATVSREFQQVCRAADITLLELDSEEILTNPSAIKEMLGIPDLD